MEKQKRTYIGMNKENKTAFQHFLDSFFLCGGLRTRHFLILDLKIKFGIKICVCGQLEMSRIRKNDKKTQTALGRDFFSHHRYKDLKDLKFPEILVYSMRYKNLETGCSKDKLINDFQYKQLVSYVLPYISHTVTILTRHGPEPSPPSFRVLFLLCSGPLGIYGMFPKFPREIPFYQS